MDEKNFEQILADALEKQRQELTQEFNEKLLVAIPEIQAAVKNEIEEELHYNFKNSKETDFVYKSDISDFSENYAKNFVENDLLSKAGHPAQAVVANEPAPVVDDTPHFDPWADEPLVVKAVEQAPGRADSSQDNEYYPTNAAGDFDPWADEEKANKANFDYAKKEYEVIKAGDLLSPHVGNLDDATCKMLGDTLVPDNKDGFGYIESHYTQLGLENHIFDSFTPQSTIKFMNQPDEEISYTLLDGEKATGTIQYSGIYQYLPVHLAQDQDVKMEYDRLSGKNDMELQKNRMADMFSENQEKSFGELKSAVAHQFKTNFPNVDQEELFEHIDSMQFKDVAEEETILFSELPDKSMHHDIKYDVVNFLKEKFGPDDEATKFAEKLEFGKTMTDMGYVPLSSLNFGDEISRSYLKETYVKPEQYQTMELGKVEQSSDLTPEMLAEVAGAESFLQEHAATAPKTAYESNIVWKPMLSKDDARLSEESMNKDLQANGYFNPNDFKQVRNYYDNTKNQAEFGTLTSGQYREKYINMNEPALADFGYLATKKEMESIQAQEMKLASTISELRPEFAPGGINPETIVGQVEKKHAFEQKHFQFRDDQAMGKVITTEQKQELRESYMDYKASVIGKDWRHEFRDSTKQEVKEIQVAPVAAANDRPNAPKLSDYSYATQETIKRGEKLLEEKGGVKHSVFKDVDVAPKQLTQEAAPQVKAPEIKSQEVEAKKQFSLNTQPKVSNNIQNMRQKHGLSL
jgi:hypothetical protein